MRILGLICIMGLPILGSAQAIAVDIAHSDYPITYYADIPNDPFGITWTTKASVPSCPVSRTAGAWGTDGKFHLTCGNCQTHTSHPNERVWDPSTNIWADGLTRPTAGVHNHSCVAIGSNIYVGGGSSGSGYTNDFTVIDLSANSWYVLGQMPVASLLYYEFATAANGRIYMFGGATGGSTIINQTWEYDPVGGAWTQKANMPMALRDVAAVGIGDTIYIAGGCNVYPAGQNNLYKYSVSGNTFTSGPNMPGSVFWAAAMVSMHPDSGPQVLVTGGQNSTTYYNTVYRYNVRGGYWATETPCGTTRRSHAADSRNEVLYVSCGYNGAIHGVHEEGVPDWVSGIQEPFIPSQSLDNITIAASPNPFTNRTTIFYNLPSTKAVELSIFDVSGKLVRKFVSDNQSAGVHALVCDAHGMSDGVYIVRLSFEKFAKTTKLILTQ